jgi:iron complex transport system substrate-binding protein
MRIASLLPSGTEIVCALGLSDQLVGISHACDWPPSVRKLPRLTRWQPYEDPEELPTSQPQIDAVVRQKAAAGQPLYQLDQHLMRHLSPDVIITQSTCQVCAIDERDVQQLATSLTPKPAVVSLGASTLTQVLEEIIEVGRRIERPREAERLVEQLRARIETVRHYVAAATPPTVCLLEWLSPLYSAGHWNPELIELAGGIPGLSVPGEPSRRIEPEALLELDPEALILAPCGLSLEQSWPEASDWIAQPLWRRLRCVQAGRLFLLDGNALFNRPGPRLIDSLELLAQCLHGERFGTDLIKLPAATRLAALQ